MALKSYLLEKILVFQQTEITEHEVYSFLSERSKGKNSAILKQISEEELHHYNIWKKFTHKDLPPKKILVYKYLLLALIFGFTFSIKKMEQGEGKAQKAYSEISNEIPEVKTFIIEEGIHEKKLIDMLDEKRLNYLSSIITGLNDAWIEVVGQLAGFTFAFQDPTIIGFAGLITGIAQFFSSSASEIQLYLTKKDEETTIKLRASLHEGIIYLITVILLVLPYFILENFWVAFFITGVSAFFMLTFLTYYVSVIKEVSMKSLIPIMLGIMIGVGTIAFIIGWIAKTIIGI
ncbi:MAG: hypothetical protein AC479_04055 [miscellaneous Crenarchaeota group-6 archaeon AD8-1]|nr:MAG: hypothetical protein AC479_04055 [miscellaneous Crenarchaeota group-6 archaeon AD8-1]